MTTDQTPAVEVLARLLCAADVHVHDGDHPSWQQLRVAQHGRGQDDYRKAARWLLPRMTVATKPAAVPVPLSTQADRRAQLLDALDFAYCQGLGFDTPEALLVAYDASRAVPVPPPADQTARRDRIADAVRSAACPGDCGNTEEECARERIQPFAWHYGRLAIVEGTPEQFADAVLAVLPEQTDRAAEAERLLSPDYEHPECGFHWHGRDGMDIPIRDGQPVCPRCELAKVEKKLAYVQRMRDEVGAECKRRGRIKLEQAERIVRLERELDGVRDQLGKEMLRADDAETELRRMAAEEQPAETQGTTADKAAALGLTDAEYRARSHAAAVATIRAAIPGMYAHVGFRLEDVLNEAATERPAVGEQPETQEADRG